MIRIVISGAFGKMGQLALEHIQKRDDFEVVALVDHKGRAHPFLSTYFTVDEALRKESAHVLVDFTTPEVVYENIIAAIRHGTRPVVGTTGLSISEVETLQALAAEKKIGGVIAPNFALGAILMMRFSEIAARYYSHAEIIEGHRLTKRDKPSGTAAYTDQLMKTSSPIQTEIHSVRLPGLVAHQAVVFGGEGEILTIRHDALSRESFMPGLLLAIEQVMERDELIYGLEKLLDLSL